MLQPSIRKDITTSTVLFVSQMKLWTVSMTIQRRFIHRFEQDPRSCIGDRISLNPILNSFQHTFHNYNIDRSLVDAFMRSMRWDLHKSVYLTDEDYKAYIYGSADAGLMLKFLFMVMSKNIIA